MTKRAGKFERDAQVDEIETLNPSKGVYILRWGTLVSLCLTVFLGLFVSLVLGCVLFLGTAVCFCGSLLVDRLDLILKDVGYLRLASKYKLMKEQEQKNLE